MGRREQSAHWEGASSFLLNWTQSSKVVVVKEPFFLSPPPPVHWSSPPTTPGGRYMKNHFVSLSSAALYY
jgi:hypothetical protein